jgi:flagellar hook-basal body complex protein FliE
MNPISALRILPADITATAPTAAADKTDFLDTLKDAMGKSTACKGRRSKSLGDCSKETGSDVHSAMIAVEKADLSFQLMMQVRTRFVQAYQEVSACSSSSWSSPWMNRIH